MSGSGSSKMTKIVRVFWPKVNLVGKESIKQNYRGDLEAGVGNS